MGTFVLNEILFCTQTCTSVIRHTLHYRYTELTELKEAPNRGSHIFFTLVSILEECECGAISLVVCGEWSFHSLRIGNVVSSPLEVK